MTIPAGTSMLFNQADAPAGWSKRATEYSPGDLEYLSWFGYSPFGVCPACGTAWSDVCYAYDGRHCV